MNGVYEGIVKFFSVQRGFGYIASEQTNGKDVWFHNVDCPRDGSPPLRECERVSFTIVEESRGLRAKNIQRVFIPKGKGTENEGNESI